MFIFTFEWVLYLKNILLLRWCNMLKSKKNVQTLDIVQIKKNDYFLKLTRASMASGS